MKAGMYAYDITLMDNGSLEIESRMHFNNIANPSQSRNTIKRFDEKVDTFKYYLNKSGEEWSKHNPYKRDINFKFELVNEKDNAHLWGLNYVKGGRGPYFRKWSYFWHSHIITHEVGHLIGLEDEYNIGGTNNCDQSSRMCGSHNKEAELKDYYYYLVLRRLFCIK